jgi:hypothetical protein
MKRCLVILLALAGVGCGPLAIGAGASSLFHNGSSDPTSPSLAIAAYEPGTSDPLASPAFVTFRVREAAGDQPVVTSEPLTLVITPNKAGVSVSALLRGPGMEEIPLDLTAVSGSLDVSAEVSSEQLVEDGRWTFEATGIDSRGRSSKKAVFDLDVDRSLPAFAPIPIRAQAREAGTVLLEWLPAAEPGVVGYRIYWAKGGDAIPDVRQPADRGVLYDGSVDVPGGVLATSYLQGGLLGTRNYYFQVVAVDEAGNESALSDTAELAARTRSGGTGTFGTPAPGGQLKGETLPVAGDATMRRLVVADLDGNRKPDFVIGADRTLYVVSDAGSVTPIDVGFATFVFQVGDVTNDRIPDIVVVDTSVPTSLPSPAGIRVFAGNGDGTFDEYLGSLPQDTYMENAFDPAVHATDLVITDLDDDGLGDLIIFLDTGFGQKQELHWLRDVMTTTLAEPPFKPFADNEGDTFTVADVDGDGTKDLIGGLEQNIFVRRGAFDPSDPTAFKFAHGDTTNFNGFEGYVGAGGEVLSVQALDLDGDGRRDFVCGLANGRLSVISNEGLADEKKLVLAQAKVITVGTGDVRVATGDFNADGLPDLAAADLGQGVVTVLVSRRGGQLDYQVSQVFTVTGLADIAVVDRNGDGLLDLAVVTQAGSIEFWFGHGTIGRGDGGFRETGSPFSGDLEIGPAADFNGDGIVDVLAAAVDQGFTLQTFLGGGYQGQGDGSFTFGPSAQSLSVQFRTGLAVGDIDNNGELDFFGNAGFDIEVYGSTFPTFQVSSTSKSPPMGGGGFVRVPAVADVNRDRFADLVLAWSDGTADLFLGNSSPLFFPASAQPLSFGTPHRWDSVVVTDVNGDGRADIASLDAGAGHVRFLLGDAFGGFTETNAPAAVDLKLGSVPNDGGDRYSPTLLVADLDGDGFSDLAAVSSYEDGEAAVAFGSSGGFLETSLLNVGSAVQLRDLHAADVDGDGLLDLIATADVTTYVWLQTSPRTFSKRVDSPIAAYSFLAGAHAAVLDFNGDSIPDLVVNDTAHTHFWMGTGRVVTFP